MKVLIAIAIACLAGPLAAVAAPAVATLTGQDYRVQVQPIHALRTAGTVLQQYDFSCGSAAIATLLTHHYGYPVAEQAVLEAMFDTGDADKIRKEGFSLLDMKNYLGRLGFAADGFEQPLDKLLEAGLPAIALIDESGYHHFVVVKGLDSARVLVGDPARGTRTMSRERFQAAWLGGLLFVIHNHTERARFNKPADWRAAPPAPIAAGVARHGVAGVDLLKNNPGDF